MDPIIVTCSAPVNIAVIKYWGKRDEKLILPVNSSLSVTLNQNELKTSTTVMASKLFEKDQFWLNDIEMSVDADRLQTCLKRLKCLAADKKNEKGEVIVKKSEWNQYKLHIVSYNDFPTAAGLASSASGFACLVFAVAQVLSVVETYPGELSSIARLGSGSACRSIYGGWVKWEMGMDDNGSDSIAIQIADENHWTDIVVLILIVSDQKKSIGSTSAMERSVHNCDFLKFRAQHIVPERIKQMEKAIFERDFATFAKLTIQDSNQFHAVCLDTYPPIFYLNDTSKAIINVLTQYNNIYNYPRAAYTFDAGPNAVIYTTNDAFPEVLDIIHHYFPNNEKEAQITVPKHLEKDIISPIFSKSIQRIIITEPGPGPQLLVESEHLIDIKTGTPKFNRNGLMI